MEGATKKPQALKSNAKTTQSNVIVFRNDPDCSIVEIISPKDKDSDNDPVRSIEAFCLHVEPRACSRVVKDLSSTLPLEDCLSHLKRVRRRHLPSKISTDATATSITPITDQKLPNQNTNASKSINDHEYTPLPTGPKTSPANDRPKKRQKTNFVLEILIGTSSRLNSVNEPSVEDHPIVREFGALHSVMVPKYEPRSEQEWKEHNVVWPTLYHPLRFEEYKKQQLALSGTELKRMKELMDRCILTRSVLIVDPNEHDPKDPVTNKSGNNENTKDGSRIDLGVVSMSRREQSLQDKLSQLQQQQQNGSSVSLLDNNPLATPILLALQGVSRREREAKTSSDGVSAIDGPSKEPDSIQSQPQNKRGQYICTGYDMYSFYEPNVFEAMACLHSRLRRLVYFVSDDQSFHCCSSHANPKKDSRITNNGTDAVVWAHGLSKHDIHNLSGTNHNYRAFEYRRSFYSP